MSTSIADSIVERIATRAEETIRNVIAQTLSEEIHRALTKALTESEFYKTITQDLHSGLGSIYKEIHAATSVKKINGENAQSIFSETSQQLDAIVDTTEKATEQIMGIVEKHMDAIAGIREKAASLQDAEEIQSYLQGLDADLMEIMTALSFQDLTGQRIKRIVHALDEVQRIVFDLYVDAGLSMKALEENPDKPVEEIRQASKAKASELKGPQAGANQSAVDDLLAQLGL
ncbi:chemotaxis protein CheZ [Thermodesulfomicrobium sp. WS]|jgi:chemotaxis protein CheZ|uniref:protein phosphatase CheZ n=1 Tax=Thermodesulfomicrobium sp. WS TaxID=3004129 RepID=UPI00249301D8|nr:protein phosphatase CheZ [Thermodesulfomicrobium sp. WS]BDV01701.1 chemotaxis protein CheZ [Thermodesulfomicrobium sp. WS]